MADINKALQALEIGTYQPGSGQIVWWEYYDRFAIDGTTPVVNYSFFAIPLGQGGKNLADTNFPLAALMPNSEKMAVMYLSLSYWPHALLAQATYQLALDMMAETTLEFNIRGIKDVFQANLISVFGNPFPALVSGAAAGDQVVARSKFQAIYELEIEIVLAANTNFTVDLTHHVAPNAALDDDLLQLSLIGPKVYTS